MLRVGFIDYLNCLPLRLGLEETGGLQGVELLGSTPAKSNASLLSGEVELGLVSSVSWARNRDRLKRVPGYGITSEGPVMSVLLAVPEGRALSETRRVALTSEAATSQVLAQILLERVYGASPSYEVVCTRPELVLAEYDAVLFIGDTALRARRLKGVALHDLGDAWKRFVGLPMVYGVWASRGDPARYEFWIRRMERAVSWAEENLEAVIGEAQRLGAPTVEEDLRTYLSSCIGYRVGVREEEGLKRYLAESGLLAPEVYRKVSA